MVARDSGDFRFSTFLCQAVQPWSEPMRAPNAVDIDGSGNDNSWYGYCSANTASVGFQPFRGCPAVCRAPSAKASIIETATVLNLSGPHESNITKRDSSRSISRSPVETHRHTRSPRRHRRSAREGVSLALKAGLASTPRSVSPDPDTVVGESIPQDHDSFIYTFLEEAIKMDKKKQRHARRREEKRSRDDDDRDHSSGRERHRHHHRDRHRGHRDEVPSRDHDIQPKNVPSPTVTPLDQSMIIETFAKLCAQINSTKSNYKNTSTHRYEVPRIQSHKSLQCEVSTKRSATYDTDHRPVKLINEKSHDKISMSRVRSQENMSAKLRTRENSKIVISDVERGTQDRTYYEKDKYPSKLDIAQSKMRHLEDERYPEYVPIPAPTRSCVDQFRTCPPEYRDYDRERRHYDEEKKKYFEQQKTSRSFDVHREGYEDERNYRRSARSDTNRIKRYDERDKRYDDSTKYYDEKAGKYYDEKTGRYYYNEKTGRYYDDKTGKFYDEKTGRYYDEKTGRYYDEKPLEPRPRNNASSKERRWRRNVERCDRVSVVSREDDYRERERDRYSERERDSGMSVADGETSTISGRSNYLKVVKSPTRTSTKTRGLLQQEIAEQREAMDKMMKLWKELMRCFKGFSQNQAQDKNIRDSADSVRDSAAAQLRLWRECMRRYETVARDVGDTDARLMEEIKKQRSEMAEMATMWQECLQRYRDMSNDFNNLKQQVQLVKPESPTRLPAQPLSCAEGEGTMPPAPYRLPPNYPPHHMPPPPGPTLPYPLPPAGSPLRGRASAPPAWWWCPDAPPRSPRRRSSPDSRTSRERDRRHRHKERAEEPRYKEKSKPSAAHSEHRHRKR